MIRISEEEYKVLLDKSDFLECLIACGVTDWQKYDQAVRMYESQEPQEIVTTTTTTTSVVTDTIIIEEDEWY